MEGYKANTRAKIDEFVHAVFDTVITFPKSEQYVTASQLKRAALSVILNYIEGYARLNRGDQRHFLRIAYGSLKETEYLLQFSIRRNFMKSELLLCKKADEIGAILYTEIKKLQN